MSQAKTEQVWWLVGAACLPAALLPISNPDLFWHLSAASRMWDSGAVPREEWLSWTMAGVAWVDFEWLSQACFGLVHAAGGLMGLWLLKAVLTLVAAWRLHAWLQLYSLSLELRAASLAVWSAAMLPRADIRPELFSIILFIEVFRRLEIWRTSRRVPSLVLTALVFALWTNLHAGFAYGLGLLALYAVMGLPLSTVAAAGLGTLANPWGWGVYRVLLSHWTSADELSWIGEWRPADPKSAWRWVELGLIPAGAAAAALASRKGRPPSPVLAVVTAGLAFASLRHARLAVYFVTAVVPLGALWLSAGGVRLSRRAAMITVALFGLWAASLGWSYGLLRRVFEPRFAPEQAARFLEQEQHILGPRKLYNPWGWGGYLGWTNDGYRVFQDGRYLFHPLLLEAGSAVASPAAWQEFLGRRGVEVAVLENIPFMLPSTRVYPDGSEKQIPRPYYAFYMPRDRWALVHFDDKALIFTRRDAVPAGWLAAREFRWLRPHDERALEDALSRGEVERAALDRESARVHLPQP